MNAAAALVLRERGSDLNMRSALLHMAADAIASLGVAVAGLVILLTGRFLWLDPVVSMAIGVLIAVEALRLVRQAAEVLLESTPKDVDLDDLTATMCGVEGVESVHDLHVWSLSSDVRALSAHVVLAGHPTLEEPKWWASASRGRWAAHSPSPTPPSNSNANPALTAGPGRAAWTPA